MAPEPADDELEAAIEDDAAVEELAHRATDALRQRPNESYEQFSRRRDKLIDAANKKAKFFGLIKQGKLKATELPRELIPTFGTATAALMLLKVVTGKFEPRSAKEAMDVAKIALELARIESGEGGLDPSMMDEAQRAALREDAAKILERVKAEALAIEAEGVGIIGVVPDPDEPTG